MSPRSLIFVLALLGLALPAPSAVAAPTRAYELVTPPDKNGGDPVVASQRVRVAADGSAVNFYSQSLFGDVIGAGLATEYISQRDPASAGSTQGWSTRGIIPPQPTLSVEALTAGIETRYMGNFSPDFQQGVLMAWRPLTDAPAVANVANLYLRDDLRSPGPGHYTLLSDCPACITPFGEEKLNLGFVPQLVTTTSDFSHVLFTSPLNLTANAKGTEEKLYEWSEGELRLASILPDGKAAPKASAVGLRSISDDGLKVFFSAAGNAYMRSDGTTTIKLNTSERKSPVTAQGVAQAIPNEDGSRVFLTTSEALTDDAPDDSPYKLYYYDATKPASDPHNLTYINYAERGLTGVSADGHTVYFMHSGQLAPGEPPLTLNGAMFAWHDGVTSFVAEMPVQDQGADGDARVSPSGNLVYRSSLPEGPGTYQHGHCSTVTGACFELLVYDIDTHHLSCASCDYNATPLEKEEQGNTETKLAANLGALAGINRTGRNFTADGDQVFFTTRASLVPEDTNGALDAYEYEVPTEEVRLISSGTGESSQTGTSDSYFLETTPSGDDVIFATRQRLLGWDTDANFDLYDARVGGGFPEPKPVPAPCNGDSCYGPLPPAPVPAAGASASFQGAGDPVPKRKKRKRSHPKKRHHNRANSDRRAAR